MTNDQTTQYLLAAGITAAALFFLVATVERLVRPGFDISRHAISMLSLGERGWVMVAVFVISGALTMLFAAGGLQPVMNTSAVLHSVAFMLAFGAVIVACFVLVIVGFKILFHGTGG